MFTQICQYLRNWFVRNKYTGDFKIQSGVLTYEDGSTLPLLSGQYYRIVGSVLNDGVWKNDPEVESPLRDETFHGAVWSMAVPPDFEVLVADITEWCSKNADAINSPYQSESFGGYSYSTKIGSNSSGQTVSVTWQSQFDSRLSPWRKI